MEKTSPTGFVRIEELFLYFEYFLQSPLDLISSASKIWSENKHPNSELSNGQLCFHEKGDDGKLYNGDVEIVMEKLGMFCDPDGEKIQESLGLDELSAMFEEKEPSMEEVKEAFDVFDENRDGFIDAWELQRVLCSLGFREGSKVEECKSMIGAFDGNGDGRIDFTEFVKFMDNDFSECMHIGQDLEYLLRLIGTKQYFSVSLSSVALFFCL
ncbi:hypothetical protein HHK36_024662 [Tetracentron sinense]|uniref:EF-hand domain-containing protein n=1 Tax=Tetracentron sinense TaxID=13715 RepID=A0A834YLB5_TETSI|nr:hypothetical protein HHK36_024662 [Tetracentron sinense]